MDNKRLRELALIGLESERARIMKEIAEIKNDLNPAQTPPARTKSAPKRRRGMNAAKRREASARMKRYWAERRRK